MAGECAGVRPASSSYPSTVSPRTDVCSEFFHLAVCDMCRIFKEESYFLCANPSKREPNPKMCSRTCNVFTLADQTIAEIKEKFVGKGRGSLSERARKVKTTAQEAHKFSCASAGTAVPLWTSSVLQWKSSPSNNNTYNIKADRSK